MRYRKLGRTDLEVSEIGFGGFAIGGVDYGPTDDRESIAAIERAFSLGVTFFDTADLYGDGHSESLLGRTLKGKNPLPVIATKVGFVGERKRHQKKDFGRSHLLTAVEQSLRRLQRDTIDLYQLHNPTLADVENGEAFGVMDELVAAGKVRFWGVSVTSRDAIPVCRRTMARPSASSAQILYNLFHRQDLEELQGEIRQRAMGVVARAPLEYGMLIGKFSKTTQFSAGDHRAWRWESKEFSKKLSQVEALKEAFERRPFSLGQLAIGFALSNPDVSVVICGAKRPSQIEENVAASELLGKVIRDVELQKARDLLTAD